MSPPSVFISKPLQSRTVPRLKRGSSLWIYYVSLLWRMERLFRRAVIVDSADREQKTKEHFQMSLGEWVSLTLLACFSFCFPLSLSLSHLALWVLTPRLSGVLLLVGPRTSSSFNRTSLHPSLSLLHPPAVSPLRPGTAVCVCDGKSMWQCPATTDTHPCQLTTLRGIPRCTSPWLPWLSAGWISGKKSHFGSARGAGYSRGDISDSGWHCAGSLYIPRSVTTVDIHSVCCQREIWRWGVGNTGR